MFTTAQRYCQNAKWHAEITEQASQGSALDLLRSPTRTPDLL
ncbi:hypothetical protein FGRA07_00522 [Fusarium graminearum]|nr:hypothetical protein FGRA07_00522 [Fusarium graminearum]